MWGAGGGEGGSGGWFRNKHPDPTLLPSPDLTQLSSLDEDKWKPDIREGC